MNAQKGFNGEVRFRSETVAPYNVDEKVFAAFDVGVTKVGEQGLDGIEFSSATQALDNGVVCVVIVGKVGVEFAGVVEDLEGKVEILLAGDHGD